MKKSLISVIFSSVLIFGLAGCGSSEVKPNPKEKAQLANGNIIAYAHMLNGTKLIKISSNLALVNDDIEIIKITNQGFYPNYSMSSTMATGDKNPHCQVKMSENATHLKFCRSNYTGRAAFTSGVSAIWNLAATASTLGLNVASGEIADPKFFQKDYFLQIVEENNLVEIRQKLIERNTLTTNYEVELNKLYDRYFKEYSENISNIKFTYNMQDSSGLLNSINLDAGYRVVLNAPNKNFIYSKMYRWISMSSSFQANNFDNIYTDVVNKLNHQFEEDKKEYKIYLETAFSTYKIEGSKEKTFKYNEHISFESTIKAPLEIKYIADEKIKIPITIIVESVTLTNMIPKQFVLSDSNMDISFTVNTNATVSTIAENKTKTFITAKSLTSYYKKDVFGLKDIDREISPESTTMTENSNYSLLSEKMIDSSNFQNITKSKAKSIKINYGYAVKYRIQNTNIDKVMYDTKKYSLYEIFQQYL